MLFYAGMRIPVTKYGWPQVLIFPSVTVVAMIVTPFVVPWESIVWVVEAILGVLLLFSVAFFRDPDRKVSAGSDILVAPADGTITDIAAVTEGDYINGPAVRIGIFLSVFNVHVNRAPCSVKVENIRYKKGEYKNAMSAESGRVNESNDLNLVRTEEPAEKLIVRQISGAIARRIVCGVKAGEKLSGGERFGMIKFGSRTELYVPAGGHLKCLVKKGDKVKAGVTALIRYEK